MSVFKNIQSSLDRFYLQTFREVAVRRAPYDQVRRHHQVVLNFAHSLKTIPAPLRESCLHNLEERFLATVAGTERAFYGPLSDGDLALVQRLRADRTEIENEFRTLNGATEGFSERAAALEGKLKAFFALEETELFYRAVDRFPVPQGPEILSAYL
ncbi:MAG: hypothetical protein AAFX94_18070, partial [Myxococcota bacterium]